LVAAREVDMVLTRQSSIVAAVTLAACLVTATSRGADGQDAVEAPACPEGQRIDDVQPQDAIVARFRGKDARIFIESCLESGPDGRTADFDLVLVLSGPDVMGGTVAVMAQGECPVAHKFVGLMELIHAEEMVALFRRHPALQAIEHLDLGVLTQLAQIDEPAAAFHVGFVEAMGWGTLRDRPGSIDWLRRSAAAGYEPAMLAVGMSLAGPGVIDEQLLPIGAERTRDADTDLAEACYWLRRLERAQHKLSPLSQSVYLDEVAPRLTPDERKRCKALLAAPSK